MGYTATAVTSVQSMIASFPLSNLLQILESVDIIGAPVVNSNGVITIGGRELNDLQYYQIYEMIINRSGNAPTNGSGNAPTDGSGDAPTGTPQYPTYFSNLNGISAYPVRPSWNVAGVDYRVGINTSYNGNLLDPSTIDSSIATVGGQLGSDSDQNTNTLEIQKDCTLDGYDFTLSGGYAIVTNGHNVTISNSSLQNLAVYAETSDSTVTLLYNEFDGLGANAETDFGAIVLLQTGVKLIAKYNYFKDAGSDVIDMTTQDCTLLYNLFDTMGWSVGAHADAIQFAGDGTANNVNIMYNTYVQSSLGVEGPSSFIDLELQTSSTAEMHNAEVAYNVASYTKTGNLDTVSGAANNGSGAIRLTISPGSNIGNNSFKRIASVGGVPNADGDQLVSVIDDTHIDLVGSTFAGAYTSGGTLRSLGSTFFRISTGDLTMTGTKLHDNYMDNSFMIGVIADSTPGTGYVKSNNILLNDGSTL